MRPYVRTHTPYTVDLAGLSGILLKERFPTSGNDSLCDLTYELLSKFPVYQLFNTAHDNPIVSLKRPSSDLESEKC